jgi:hypothetical protein
MLTPEYLGNLKGYIEIHNYVCVGPATSGTAPTATSGTTGREGGRQREGERGRMIDYGGRRRRG